MAGAEARVVLTDDIILDFGGLFSAANRENQAPRKPQDELLEATQYEEPIEEEKPVEGKETAQNGTTATAPFIPALTLLRQAEQEANERERSLEICRRYQDNIRVAGGLRTDILKGVRAGEDIHTLFLKAVKAISLMTSDTLFNDQIEADIKAIYGYGLGAKAPLQIELEEVRKRLQKLTEAAQREQEHDSKQRIQAAIKRHKSRITELEELISKAS